MNDPLGAFVPGGAVHIEGPSDGALSGVRLAVKDIYDIAGMVTGCGNPDWARSHPAAERHAAAVQALLDAGVTVVGKVITDELAYSLNGKNFHYGTPTNSNAPGRIPGGSSCGSASAVAGGAADIALGSDTGGSVRIPASYCGIYGIRPTHGRISLDGVMPLAPSLDTVGWFARDAGLLRRVGEALLGESASEAPEPARLIFAEDAMERATAATRAALQPLFDRLEARFGGAERIVVGEPGGGLGEWVNAFRAHLGGESWISHRDWIENDKPNLGPETERNFEFSRSISAEALESARAARRDFAARTMERLSGNALLCLPTAPDIAPLLTATTEELAEHRIRVHCLTCTAGLAGLPQVTLPLGEVDGCPVGFSLIAGPGGDMMLLRFAEAFVDALETGPEE